MRRCNWCGAKTSRGKCVNYVDCDYKKQRIRWLQKARECPCGKLYVPKGGKQKYCSKTCPENMYLRRYSRVGWCDVCRTFVVKADLREHGAFLCGLDCQRKHALDLNRGKPSVDWQARSAKAKQAYKNQRRRERSKKYARVKQQLNKLKSKRKQWEHRQTVEGEWEYRIRLRVNGNRHRDCVGRKKKNSKPKSTGHAIALAERRFAGRCSWRRLDPWRKKITNKLSNLRSRRRRKANAKKHRESSLRQNQKTKVQMRFEWD